MAYVKNTWVDQSVERPKTYEMTNNADGSVTLIDSFGLVDELGTPVNADNMNHIEDGIAGCDLRKYNLLETYEKGEWVTGTVEDEKGIYESLKDNNYGNSLTDTEYWQKVELGGSVPDEIITQLNQLSDDVTDRVKLDGSNAEFPYIKETYVNGTSGYIIYSNGYCEQWGRGSASSSGASFTFLKAFKDTNYLPLCTRNAAAKYEDTSMTVHISSTSAITLYGQDAGGRFIRACGYLAEGDY